MKSVLIIAAHPDDEVIGCGGTIAKLSGTGLDVYTLVLGEGITSRASIPKHKQKEALGKLTEQAMRANAVLGVKDVIFKSLPDNKFDSLPLLDIVKVIEEVKNEIRPDTIFTHYANDLNIDHQIVYKAVITAARPLPDETVKQIYSFEVLSSTEWNFPQSFSPNVFYDISESIGLKTKALKEYEFEIRKYPHPRSIETIESNSKVWGSKVGLKFAEAFECVRVLR